MARYRSPFSVAQRKTVVISSSDPRSIGLENFRSKLGSDVKVKNLGTPLQFSKAYWMEVYDSNETSQATNATIGDCTAGAVDQNENFIVGGYTKNGSAVNHGTLMSIIPGKLLNWQKRFDNFNTVLDIETDSDSNIYMLLTKISSNYPYLVKYNSSGTLLWQSTIPIAADNLVYTSTVVLDSSDNPIFAVRINSPSQSELIVKLNKTDGAIIWQKRLAGSIAYFRMATDINGDICFVSTSSTGTTHNIGKILSSTGAYDTSFYTTGVTNFNVPVGTLSAIAIDKKDADKNIYVVWSGLSGGAFDGTTETDVIYKFSSVGILVWKNPSNALSGIAVQINGPSSGSSRGTTSTAMGKLHIKNNKFYYETKTFSGGYGYVVNGNISDGSINGYFLINNISASGYSKFINVTVPLSNGDIYGGGRYEAPKTNASGTIVSHMTRFMTFRMPGGSSFYNKSAYSISKDPDIKVNFSYSYNRYTVLNYFGFNLSSYSGLTMSTTTYALDTSTLLVETNLSNQISFTQFTIAS